MNDTSIQTPCVTCGETTEVIRGTDSIEEATRNAHCAACIADERRNPMSKSVKFKICNEGGHKYNATDFEHCPKCAAEKEEAEQLAAAPTDPVPGGATETSSDPSSPTAETATVDAAVPANGEPPPVWSAFARTYGETDKDRDAREEAPARPAPKPRREFRMLLCAMAFDDLLAKRAEHIEKGDELEKLERQFEANEEAHRDAKKALQSKIDVAKDEERELRRIVKSAKVERKVECVTEIRGSNAYVLRTDTFDIIEERAATRDELQHELPFPDETVNPTPAELAAGAPAAAPEGSSAPAAEGPVSEPAPPNEAKAALEDGAKKKRARKGKKGSDAQAEG